MTAQANVLDHGFVRLDDFMANDLSVVNSARISFNKRKDEMDNADIGLINMLMRDKHGTPFEHNAMRFHVKAPIFIFREWQRHRIGSFNEMSARYTELPGEWFIPELINIRKRVGKPGAYTHEVLDGVTAISFQQQLMSACEQSYKEYKAALLMGIAPELARCFLHVNHYSEMFWTVNARSLMNFLNLRNAPTAQWEIQQYAIEVEKIFMSLMPHTHAAFVNHDRVAP